MLRYGSAFFHGITIMCGANIGDKMLKKNVLNALILGRERVSEAIGQNFQVWAAG